MILCVHGWPELWYSWRHQIDYFAEQGYQVVAMDVRGYGGSSKPEPIEAYTLSELASDVAGVAAQVSSESVILFGHDWGAPIVYATALLHPERIKAVAGLSVPFMPHGEESSLVMWEALYADRFFYQLYFQQEGVVEKEVEADLIQHCARSTSHYPATHRITNGLSRGQIQNLCLKASWFQNRFQVGCLMTTSKFMSTPLSKGDSGARSIAIARKFTIRSRWRASEVRNSSNPLASLAANGTRSEVSYPVWICTPVPQKTLQTVA